MRRVAWGLLVVWLLGSGHAAAGPYDPALRFLTLETAHFQIHYHRGEEAMAERLSRIAEATHTRLSTAWALGGDRRTHVVLVDQTDVSNGTATVVPWNAIVIYPVPPTGAETIGDTNDWLEYVFVHEYAHILHLDQSRGWARLARGLFGRTVIGFPNLTLPLWQIEGLATLVESEGGLGRLHGGDFREVVDAAGRAGRLEPLDRVNGGLADWPGGQGWYAYGARFHEFLARTYGAQRLGELAAATAGKPPFITSGAFSEVYGKSLGQLWKEFEATVVREGAPMPASSSRPLTSLGYLVDAPREGADGAIYFTTADADRFPGIYRLSRGATVAEQVVSRYGGTGISVSDREMLFDQLELVRGSALMSDLYLRDLRTGRTRRLTRETRLSMADRSQDGTRIAAVQVVAGARDLVVLDAVSLTASSAVRATSLPVLARAGVGEAVFANPRWSPDGRTLAAERRQRNGPSTIVLLDGETLGERGTLAGGEGDRLVNPAWSSDGATLYYAHAVGERPFQLRAVDLGPGGRISLPRPLPEVAGGARAPLPLRDGRMVFVGYTTAGYDLFELPDAVSSMTATVSPADSPQQPASEPAGPGGPARPARPAGPASPAPRASPKPRPIVPGPHLRLAAGCRSSSTGMDAGGPERRQSAWTCSIGMSFLAPRRGR